MRIKQIKTIAIFFIALLSLSFSSCVDEPPIVEWKDGIVPYFLTGSFSGSDITDLDKAMARWERECGILFIEVMPQSYAYEVKRVSNNLWTSSVGENNIQSYMFFADGEPKYGHILHELGHCIGLLHEHQRPDRDNFVTVHWDNIFPEYEHNFYRRDNPLYKEQEFVYDLKSIMGYSENAFSINGSPTLTIKSGLLIERGDELSDDDPKKCSKIYGAPKKKSDYEDYFR